MASVVPSPDQGRQGLSGSPRRKQVIDAAAAIMARHGYRGASIRTLADSLGIKAASVYFHVASKEDALAEICMIGLGRTRTYLRDAMACASTLPEQIRLFFSHQRDDQIERADYLTVSVRESHHLTGAAKERWKQETAAFRKELDDMFTTAAARGDLHPAVTPRQARFIMIGTMRTLSELHTRGSIQEFDAMMAAWVETLVRGLATASSQA